MWWMIVTVLLIEWWVGIMSQYTLGGFIHLLPVAAIATAVTSTLQDRKHSSRRLLLKTGQNAIKQMNVENFGANANGWRFH